MAEMDRRPYIKLSTDYFENFKILELTDRATLLHLYLITQAGKNLSDGIIPETICTKYGPKPFQELKTAGLIHKIGPKKWQIHDYTKHQTSRARARGNPTKGAHTTHHTNTGTIEPTCTYCQQEHPDITASQNDKPPF